MTQKKELITPHLERHIWLIRGQKVMLDVDLAVLYGIPTKRLNEAIKRNPERFPADFMFQLTHQELINLRSQFATSRLEGAELSEKNENTAHKHGGKRYLPYVFTEHGVAMLSSVLRSSRAIEMNLHIMRTFVRLREMMATNKDFADRIQKIEDKQERHESVIEILIDEIDRLKEPPPLLPKRRIGFIVE